MNKEKIIYFLYISIYIIYPWFQASPGIGDSDRESGEWLYLQTLLLWCILCIYPSWCTLCPCHPAQRSRNCICRGCLLPWPSGFYLGPTKGKPQQEMGGRRDRLGHKFPDSLSTTHWCSGFNGGLSNNYISSLWVFIVAPSSSTSGQEVRRHQHPIAVGTKDFPSPRPLPISLNSLHRASWNRICISKFLA